MKINKQQLQQIIKEELETIKEMRVRASKGNVHTLLNTCGELLWSAANYFARQGQAEEQNLARIYREAAKDVTDMKQALIDSMK